MLRKQKSFWKIGCLNNVTFKRGEVMKFIETIHSRRVWNKEQISRLRIELLTSDTPLAIVKLIYGYEQQNLALSFVLERAGE